jgi:hypothetical protein
MPSSAPHTYSTPASATAPALTGAAPGGGTAGEGPGGETVGDATGRADAVACDVADAGSVRDPTSPVHAVTKRATTRAIRRPRIRPSVMLTGSARIRFGAL